MTEPEQLDELLAQEIERRLGPPGALIDGNLLRILLHSLRGSAAMAGHGDLALAVAQLEQRQLARDMGIEALAAGFLRDVARRLRARLPPLETQWPVPPAVLVPSVVSSDQRADYRTAMFDRLTDLDTVITAQEPCREALEHAYRLVHMMKAQASSVGDDSTAWYCHGLEDRLRAGMGDERLSADLLAQLARHSGAIARLLDDPSDAFHMLRALQSGQCSVEPPKITTVRPATVAPSSFPPPATSSWIDELDAESELSMRLPASTAERLFDHLEHVDAVAEQLMSVSDVARGLDRRLLAMNHEVLEAWRLALATSGTQAESQVAHRLEQTARELLEIQAQVVDMSSTCSKSSRLLRSQWAETRGALSQLRRSRLAWVFERVASAARMFARAEGKTVRVRAVGGDISIERSRAERLLEAVMQVVRNSITHGIDLPEIRQAAGKLAEGTLTLVAERLGDWLRLSIDDDGRGVDVSRVRELVVERGLATQEAASRMGHRELFNFLFLPGLSTRRDADLLAGRGVGLDLARDIMRRLGGSLRLSSLPSGGIRATLECPIERGLIDVVWLESSGQFFALPVAFAGQVRSSRHNKRRALSLAACVGLRENDAATLEIDVVVPGVQPIALGIDALGQVEDVIVRPLPPLLSQLGPFAGAVLRGDGSLRLVLDPAIVSAELWSHDRPQ